MDTYKETIRIRTSRLTLVAAGTALLYIVLMFYRDRLPDVPSFIKGFHIGAFLGLELIIAFYLGKLIKVRNNDAALKSMYVAERDERTGLILRNASTLGMSVVFIGFGVAIIVSGFFNIIVFFTLLGALAFILIVFYTLWVYYARKF